MMLSSVVAIVALAVVVKAQDQPPPTPTPFLTTLTTTSSPRTRAASDTGTVAAAAATHTIAVGASGFAFSRPNIQAEVGDTIEWVFYPDGHSVIRAEFGFPCTPYEYIDIGRAGFYSGPEAVKAITNDMPRYRVRVNDTLPIFYYCGAPGSCYKEKMIGVINENSTHTLDKQLEAALPLTTQIIPGEPFPTESDASKATGGSGGSGGSVINNYTHGLSGGAIAGVVIGAAALILFGGLLVYLCGRRGGLNRAYKRASTFHPGPPPGPPPPPVTEINYLNQPKSPETQGWRSSYYSQFSGPYRDQPTPLNGYPSPSISPQPTGYAHPMNSMQPGYYDPRISSIAPSVVVEAPDNQAPAPVAPAAVPAELPAPEDSANQPLPGYDSQVPAAEKEAGYHPPKGQI